MQIFSQNNCEPWQEGEKNKNKEAEDDMRNGKTPMKKQRTGRRETR